MCTVRNYNKFESHIIECCQPGTTVIFQGEPYTIEMSGKPRPTSSRGECKTDVYLLLRNDDGIPQEVKISLKLPNADFIENKVKMERAKTLFGNDYKSILLDISHSVSEALDGIHQKSHPAIPGKSLRLGYRLDIVNKRSGRQSIPASMLSRQSLLDVLSGSKLPVDKRDSQVGGIVIPNSGVAEHILVSSPGDIHSAQDVFDQLVSLDDYLGAIDPHIAFKAVNYRPGKRTENRSLLVSYNYFIDNNGEIVFSVDSNRPLEKTSVDIQKNVPKNVMDIINGKCQET